jgi:hypothetical protein
MLASLKPKGTGDAMRDRGITAALAASVLFLSFAAPALAGDSRIEAFVGYYYPEELDSDVSYGARYGWDSGRGWGWMLAYEMFETTGTGYHAAGVPVRNVDAERSHLEVSWVTYPTGKGLELFLGAGATAIDDDIPVHGHIGDFDKTTFSFHSGIGWRGELGETLYWRPELRFRMYDAEDETVDITASIALGFDFGE